MKINRRSFLKRAGAAAAALAATPASLSFGDDRPVTVIITTLPPRLASLSISTNWAIEQLISAFHAKGIACRTDQLQREPNPNERVVCLGPPGHWTVPPSGADNFCCASSTGYVVVLGENDRGWVYGLLELTDRVRYSRDPLAEIWINKIVSEIPHNKTRSISRYFVSEVEDKAWFNDRDHWTSYLTMLATHRFNRFSLNFGLGYDSAEHVSDGYFVFPYPSLVKVSGYDVRADGVSDDERDANLAMLIFISDEAARRGLDFQLGIWTHAYKWVNSPHATNVITGLNPDNHAAYCRDALAKILWACPSITGVTLRVHGESGVPEGSFSFWQTLFDAIKNCGRKIELDMHAKGMTQEQIDIAAATGQKVVLSPKWCGEHMGLPYHPMSIRAQEMRKGTKDSDKINGQSLRYGYGNLLKEDRNFGVLFRIWPGTQRFLLGGDPELYAGFGRSAHFCGAEGVEFCEPLSFKGREGSGLPGGRLAYADQSLNTKYDWEKYLYQYRLWGRKMYDPDCEPESWQRYLRAEFGGEASAAENALAAASRVLPLITLTHAPSAANNRYWPEIYTNMPIVEPDKNPVYVDTPEPKVFGTASPFDPQLFAGVDEFADAGDGIAKYTPSEVAQWLHDLSAAIDENANKISSSTPERRRVREDLFIQSGIAKFFAWKFSSAVLWRKFRRRNEPVFLQSAIGAYRAARDAWMTMAQRAKSIYVSDISYGGPTCRGHWADRLSAIDADIAKMSQMPGAGADHSAWTLDSSAPPARPALSCQHTPPPLQRGEPLGIGISFVDSTVTSIRLHYRRVNQAEQWQAMEMQPTAGGYRAQIPADYVQSPYPIQYYFESHSASGVGLHPGLAANLSNQPYYVVG